ncbi:MAG TPA: YciI family protein [Ignavibacteria bacterium]|jgi:uncharacterized protein YciI
MDEKKHFIYIIRPRKENFAETMTEEEAGIMSKHFVYLQDLMSKGKLVLAGPETSGKFGIAIFEAENLEHAKELTANDPAVNSGIVTAEIYPYRISLLSQK